MNRIKTIAKWVGIVGLALLLFAIVLPFLIPVSPLENLCTAQSLALPESQFVTLPFEGTDGIDMHLPQIQWLGLPC